MFVALSEYGGTNIFVHFKSHDKVSFSKLEPKILIATRMRIVAKTDIKIICFLNACIGQCYVRQIGDCKLGQCF